ncbi:FtsK/SpoIIIE domain-containing protein [Actinacidiphila rubida]|uniref:DNA segregation ATPase FtsK/SpoIIIE, S-DNA-T family n=1 Tax=Actinacidiphila rubida TaxID=310780 RepID=A0A1H8DK13_9ACTN|nr:FtsK/SpoIIIE domain-containing protein [Actinacidiphila rubida]SEN07629.1 DNA segregation ATPase FtsK/SpoIIIE, S-DNA-T family [Actinacidiphila rubida]
MRLSLTVVDPLGGDRADVLVDTDPASTVADVARALGQKVSGGGAEIISISGGAARTPGSPAVYVDGYALDPNWSVAQSPLREGAVVSLYDPAGCLPGEPAGMVELRVAGGPDAGAVHRLGLGRVEIGRGPSARVRVNDTELADRAAVLTVGMGGTCQVTIGGETKDWPLGDQLALGNSLLELGPYMPPNAALQAGEDGATYEYNRPPRLSPPERATMFRLPSPPKEPNARPLPWLMALMPLIMAVTMAFMMHRMTYLIMAVASPLVMVGNYFLDKKNGRKSFAKTVTEYRERKEAIEGDANTALDLERKDRAAASPDPATVLNTATGPRTRLWERRRSDADHLLIRVGTAKLPSEVVLDDPEQEEHRRKVNWEIENAPVAVELRRLGVVGFAAPGDGARAMGRWAVAQAATLSSPMDVQFYVLTEQAGQESWDWVRWLPHARPTDGQDATALMGTDAETVAARIAELGSILDGRQKAKQKAGSAANHAAFFKDPDIVVVLDGSRRLRAMPGVVQLLREGPGVGMFMICLDSEERFLPGECQAVVVAEFEALTEQAPVASVPQPRGSVGPQGGFPSANAWYAGAQQAQAVQVEPEFGAFRLRVEQAGSARIRKVRPDLVSPAWCARLARCLSPIRDISGDAEDSAIPSASRLLDVLQLEPPTPDAIAARWRVSPISTQAMVGESYDGPFAIDIRKDGPHGLIAGTTGSGKSELLQTIVASLAVANTPEAMTFVLVDYKGGSAFKDCVQLPHTVGMVTDLDAHLVERALESLGAELKRREHILAEAGAKDIEDYTDFLKRTPELKPMPRLLIVIDEFASMVRELPDFVTGLVNIAQRGRSLGIHLLLATQRPSGVVSPEIRANTNLRIALRVTDGSESSDVIDAPDAGNISKSTPGRAFVRLGATSLVPFQSGRVGGRRPGAVENVTVAPWVGIVDWAQLGRSAPQRPAGAKGEDDEITDLKVLVEAICGANERMGIPAQHSPWLPALPDSLQLDELPLPAPFGSLPAAPYGVEDLPALQARRPVAIDFHTFGHLLAAGAPRSGRSQLLRTIAGSLARTLSAADLHLYGIDCGNGALNALTRLPHCGAVVGRSQSERAIRLIGRLKAEMTHRQELLAADGFADIGEQRAAAATEEERLAHIVILLDRWEGFMPSLGELDHGALTDEIFTFLREGASVGIHLIITGDRTLMAGRISTLTEDKIAFRLADRGDFSLISINPRKIPEEIQPGRAYRSESAVELQVALLNGDSTGQGQAAAIAAIGEAATARDAGLPRARRPFRVDVLPSRLSFADAWEMRDTDAARDPLWALVGVGGDELTGYGPNLSDGLPAFVIGGPGKSGRSTLLMTLARSYQQQGVKLVIATPRPSPLRGLAGGPGVLRTFTDSDIPADEMSKALEEAEGSPVVVLVDDAELLKDCEAKDILKDIIARGSDHGRAVVIAGGEEDICSGFSGWQVDAKKARRGVLLSPQQTMSGELIGTRLSRSTVGGQVTPGRALLHLGDGEPKTVTVPLTD